MCKIIIEHCLKNVPNKFELVLIAAKLAQKIKNNQEGKINSKNKITYLALKEIEKVHDINFNKK